MKKTLYMLLILLTGTSLHTRAQRTSTMKKDFDIGGITDSVNIVVIRTNDIPQTLNKTLSSDNKPAISSPTTIYTNPANQVHVVHVNNTRGNNTYVFQKNSDVILMLKPGKRKIEKNTGLATK